MIIELIRKYMKELELKEHKRNEDMTYTQMYKMAGNSIVIKVEEGILENLKGIIY